MSQFLLVRPYETKEQCELSQKCQWTYLWNTRQKVRRRSIWECTSWSVFGCLVSTSPLLTWLVTFDGTQTKITRLRLCFWALYSEVYSFFDVIVEHLVLKTCQKSSLWSSYWQKIDWWQARKNAKTLKHSQKHRIFVTVKSGERGDKSNSTTFAIRPIRARAS